MNVILRPRLTALVCGVFLISNVLLTSEQKFLFAVFSLVTVICSVVLWRGNNRAAALALLLVVAIVPAREGYRIFGPGVSVATIANRSVVEFQGQLEWTKVKQGGKSYQFYVRTKTVFHPDDVKSGELVLCRVPAAYCAQWTESLCAGLECTVRGYVIPVRTAVFPWDFNESNFLRIAGVEKCVRVVNPAGFRVGSMPTCTLPNGEQLRRTILAVHRKALGERLGDLLSSIVIGERAVLLPNLLKDEFRAVGLSHILAASGFNITLAAIMIWTIARYFTRSRLLLNVLFAVSVALFLSVAGTSPSITRAALMAGIAIVAGCHHKQPYAPASILLALSLSCLAAPQSYGDIGLQLSYVTTGGIIFFVSFLSAALEQKMMIKRPFCHLLSGVLIAQSVVLPLQIYYFWQVGLLSVIANIMISPLIAPIAMLGFASSFLAGLDWAPLLFLADCLDRLNWIPLEFVLWLVHFLASFRSLIISIGPPQIWQMIIYYLAWLFCMFQIRALRKKAPLGLLLPVSFLILVTALCLLFVRAPLRGTLVICMPGVSAMVRADRKALVIGDAENLNMQRALRYLGAQEILTHTFPPEDAVRFNNLAIRSNALKCGMQEHSLRARTGSLVFLQEADNANFAEVKDVDSLFK